MNVNELMSRELRAVRIGARLDAAARVLWDGDCGLAPVGDGVVIGVLTDRDLCMASYTQGRSLGEIPVAAVMAREVRTCRAEDTLASALATMQEAQVRRLPVVDARGVLVGVLSCNDLVRAAVQRPAAVDGKAVLQGLAVIGASRRDAGRPAAASAAAPAPTPASAAPAKPAATPAATPAAKPAGATRASTAAAEAAGAPAPQAKSKGRSRSRAKKA